MLTYPVLFVIIGCMVTKYKITKKLVPLLFGAALFLSACGVDREAQLAKRDEGLSAMASADYKKALGCFDEALAMAQARVTDYEVNISYYKAAAQFLSGDRDGALITYTNLIEFDKDNASNYFLRGSVYLDCGEKKKGLKDYRRAVGIKRDDYELYLEIYNNLLAYGLDGNAAEFLNMALEIEGDSPEYYMYRGRIYMLLTQYEVARITLQKAVDRGSDEAKVYLAQVYDLQGDKETAKKLIDEYVAVPDLSAQALVEVGNLLIAQGEYDQALAIFRQGIEMNDADAMRGLLKGEVAALEFTGDFASAKAKAKEYMESFPADAQMQREMVFLNSR